MTLQYSNPNQQAWTCFVCGIQFKNNYFELKEHILQKHDEGKDYIICPLKRCNAPVRDVRSHFKAKHPKETIPETCQMQATTWRDFGDKKQKRKIKFQEGYVVSIKNHGKPMHYRSSYEKSVYESLEKINEVVAYEVEPFPVPYYYKGTKHDYYPDLCIKYADGHIEVWEIKPGNQTSIPINVAKWNSCEEYCINKGWSFSIKTEQEIEKLKNLF